MAGIKNSDAEVQIIVNQIISLMIRGITRNADIMRYISVMDEMPREEQLKHNWHPVKKSKRMIENYLQKAEEQIKEEGMKELNTLRNLYSARLDDLYAKAIQKGKLQTANNIIKTMLYLQGIGNKNIRANFKVTNFDVELTEDEENKFKEDIERFLNKDITEIEQ